MSKLIDAMGLVNQLHKSHGIAQRGGKKYTQVVHRMEAFRTVFGLDIGIDTDVLVDDGQRVVVKAVITNADGMTIGSGMAEEIRGQGNVNKTSALENCETSAIGRALAALGLSGGEYASANEMDAVPRKEQAIQQNQMAAPSSTPPTEDVATSSQAPEPPSDPTEDEHAASDKIYYRDVSHALQQMEYLGQLHDYFGKNKPMIKELKDRAPEKAKHMLALFNKHEARLKG